MSKYKNVVEEVEQLIASLQKIICEAEILEETLIKTLIKRIVNFETGNQIYENTKDSGLRNEILEKTLDVSEKIHQCKWVYEQADDDELRRQVLKKILDLAEEFNTCKWVWGQAPIRSRLREQALKKCSETAADFNEHRWVYEIVKRTDEEAAQKILERMVPTIKDFASCKWAYRRTEKRSDLRKKVFDIGLNMAKTSKEYIILSNIVIAHSGLSGYGTTWDEDLIAIAIEKALEAAEDIKEYSDSLTVIKDREYFAKVFEKAIKTAKTLEQCKRIRKKIGMSGLFEPYPWQENLLKKINEKIEHIKVKNILF